MLSSWDPQSPAQSLHLPGRFFSPFSTRSAKILICESTLHNEELLEIKQIRISCIIIQSILKIGNCFCNLSKNTSFLFKPIFLRISICWFASAKYYSRSKLPWLYYLRE